MGKGLFRLDKRDRGRYSPLNWRDGVILILKNTRDRNVKEPAVTILIIKLIRVSSKEDGWRSILTFARSSGTSGRLG